jgi:hypothetical protein
MKYWKIPIHEAIKFAKIEVNRNLDNRFGYAFFMSALDMLIEARTNGTKFIYTEQGQNDKNPDGYEMELIDASEVPESVRRK